MTGHALLVVLSRIELRKSKLRRSGVVFLELCWSVVKRTDSFWSSFSESPTVVDLRVGVSSSESEVGDSYGGLAMGIVWVRSLFFSRILESVIFTTFVVSFFLRVIAGSLLEWRGDLLDGGSH